MSLELTIVTAEKRFHFAWVTQVVIPTPLGQIGILPGHAPLVSIVTGGVLRIMHADPDTTSPKPSLLALDTGMARVTDDHIVLLVSQAITPDEIDRKKILARTQELNAARASHTPLTQTQRQALDEESAFTQAQLEVMDAMR